MQMLKDIKMTDEHYLNKIFGKIEKGMKLSKCRNCGCMQGALDELEAFFGEKAENYSELFEEIKNYQISMHSREYNCLGCEYCYPAVAANHFNSFLNNEKLNRHENKGYSDNRNKSWPFVNGEYYAFCEGSVCPVAVSTLSDAELAEKLALRRPAELCIVGKTKTENIGVEKVVKNIITNPTIRFLLLAGSESKGHLSGKHLYELWKNGVDENMKVKMGNSKGSRLSNLTLQEVEAFRNQVEVIDMIGCEQEKEILSKIHEISQDVGISCCCETECAENIPYEAEKIPIINAERSSNIELDEAGYFVIFTESETKSILVEHYSYENELLNTVEGNDAKSIYQTIIRKGWLTHLSHAAYLGEELAKAELSNEMGFKYVQEGA